MPAFLDEIINRIDENQLADFYKQLYIFPSKRAGIYFARLLKKRFPDAVFLLPEILTIQEFIVRYTQYRIADDLEILIDLHRVHTNVSGMEQAFDKFLPWGNLLLKDFDECDKYLVDAQKLFSLLDEQKSLEDFSFLDKEMRQYIEQFLLTTLTIKNQEETYKQHFIKTWKLLGEIYTQLNEVLLQQNKAYEGMAYKNVLERLDIDNLQLPFEKISIAGFNALTICEEKIFKCLAQKIDTIFYWDIDADFLENAHHEAGYFMRLNKQVFHGKNSIWIDSKTPQAEIEICGVASDVGQAQYAASLIDYDSEHTTALVLCDQQLLHPLLYSIDVEKCNIAMGYPAVYHEVYAYTKSLIHFFARARLREKNTDYYYHDVEDLLNAVFLKNEISDLDDLKKIVPYFVPYFPQDILKNHFPEFLFTPDFSIVQLLRHTCDLLKRATSSDVYFRAIRNAMTEAISAFADLVENQNTVFTREMLPQLFRQYFSAVKIPFETISDSNIQLLGFLETRLIDFDEVILLSVNDDKLPGSSKNNSFIPYNLRKGFGMPTFELFDGISAYHFYRLLKRAKKVSLLYNNKSGDDAGEKSRFIRQIEYEWKQKGYNIKHKIIVPQANTISTAVQEFPIKINKTDYMSDTLYERVYSATALKLYIKCPLQFYLRYVEKIEEPDTLSEDFDDGTFGLVLHKTLEIIYKKHIGKKLSKQQILLFCNAAFIRHTIKEACTSDELNLPKELMNSRHSLKLNVIENYVLRILQNDAKEDELCILHTEGKFRWENLKMENGKTVAIEGTFDRVDKMKGDTIRIVDYKTGMIHLPEFPADGDDTSAFLDAIFTYTDKEHDYSAALQGLLYALIYYKIHDCKTITIAYHHTRSITSGLNYLNNGNSISISLLHEFEKRLSALLSDIIYKETQFIQSENSNAYTYSPYAEMLGMV